jgi:hypothetical protein
MAARSPLKKSPAPAQAPAASAVLKPKAVKTVPTAAVPSRKVPAHAKPAARQEKASKPAVRPEATVPVASKAGSQPTSAETLTSVAVPSIPAAGAPVLEPVVEVDLSGFAVVKYNHYKKAYAVDRAGTLAWKDIDDEYCISFAFGDDCKVFLHLEPDDATNAPLQLEPDGKFAGVIAGSSYVLRVIAGEEFAAAASEVSTAAAGSQSVGSGLSFVKGRAPGDFTSAKGSEITRQMLALSVDQLGSEQHKAMLEARDLEDLLFGGL